MRISTFVAPLLALSISVTACSSSGDSASSNSSGGGTSAATGSTPAGTSTPAGSSAPSGTPIKIGVICSCTGPFGVTIESAAKLAQAWAKDKNASGGVEGHPVDLTVEDDASNPGTSVTKAKEMIKSKPAFILDLTNFDAAWSQLADAAKIPVVAGNLNSTLYFSNPNWYPSGQTNDVTVQAVVAMAKQAGVKKMGLLYCAEAPVCAEIVKVAKGVAEKQGIQLVYSSSVAATAPNFTAQCVAAKQAGVDGMFIAASAGTFGRVAADCVKQSYNPTWLEVGTGYQKTLATNPGTKDKLWMTHPMQPFFADIPPIQEMNKVVNKYYPGLPDDKNKWTEYSVQAWAGLQMAAKALKNAAVTADKDVTPDVMATSLATIKDETLDGLTVPVTLEAGKTHSTDCWFIARVQGGKESILNDGKPYCSS
jgi:branched-chain amino acid transport system substrate-binding protein